jgi:hypothetical protein
VTGTAAVPSEDGDARQSGHPGGVIFGRFMLADLTEHPCRVKDLSIDGVTFLTDVDVEPLAELVAYIQNVGRFEGTVVEIFGGGIRVAFRLSSTRRQRLASHLDRGQSGVAEQRRHHRLPIQDNASHITLADGRVYPCEVIDISLSGAALRTAVLPCLGTLLGFGKMRGRVVRYHASGIAVEFLKLLDRTALAGAAKAEI